MVVFKDNVEPFETDDFWYDLFEGGYLKLEDYLQDTVAINSIKSAVKTLAALKDSMQKEGLIYDL